jgi:hypothetical protein
MIDADWHRAHRMPKHPTLEQRLEWHREHALHCDCREPPPKLAALLAAHAGSPPQGSHGEDPKRG